VSQPDPVVESEIYRIRFSDRELQQQREFWRPICRYLENYMNAGGATLDLGAGYCHFINNVRSLKKYALDINEENLRLYAKDGVELLVGAGTDIALPNASLDTVFASNVYEHFHTREDVARSFTEVRRTLRPGGRFLVLQPNFAYCSKRYFDFFDHRLAFTHRAIAEGIQVAGFDIVRVIPQFLPFTSKSKLPKSAWLVGLYLRMPLAWRLFGGQMLVVAEKPR
jgi:SAM-dependent methyltransferase